MQENKKYTTLGMLSGLIAALIWGGFPVMTRLSLKATELDYLDITFLRFFVSGLILLPFLVKTKIKEIQYFVVLFMVIGIGAPYMLIVSIGLQGAPVEQFAALTPGTMIVFSMLLGFIWLKEKPHKIAGLGVLTILLGIAFVAYTTFNDQMAHFSYYLYFLLGALMWASYTVTTRRYQVSAFDATVIVCVFSMFFYIPIYFYLNGLTIFEKSAQAIVIHGIYQGVFVSIIALFFYSKAVQVLGSLVGSTFAALVPGIATLLASLLLNEIPPFFALIGLALITAGMIIVILGPNLNKKLRKS